MKNSDFYEEIPNFLVLVSSIYLLPLVGPIVNFKAAGCEHERLLFECGDTTPIICFTCVVICLCVLGTAENMEFSTSSVITLGCCDARIQDVVALEARILWAFPPPPL